MILHLKTFSWSTSSQTKAYFEIQHTHHVHHWQLRGISFARKDNFHAVDSVHKSTLVALILSHNSNTRCMRFSFLLQSNDPFRGDENSSFEYNSWYQLQFGDQTMQVGQNCPKLADITWPSVSFLLFSLRTSFVTTFFPLESRTFERTSSSVPEY